MEKVIATKEAQMLLNQLQAQHGELVLIHSEGCCDGTFPLCTVKSEFYQGAQMEQIGELGGVPYYMHHANASYWQHLQIVIDVTDGLGNSFSLESSENKTFIIQAKKR